MANKDNNDDLYIEEDLTADFLSETELKGEPAPEAEEQIVEAPAEPVANKPADSNKTNPSEEMISNDTHDWVEDEKVDLPGQLALDIYETKDDLIVMCRIAGVEEKNIDVSISADNILNIRGNLVAKIEENVENHFIQECYWGEFSRSISLPVDVKKENINATLENGILKIIFIKIKQDAIKKINIKTSR